MPTFCLGDVHGHAAKLKLVLAQSKFDFEKDELIVLGDLGDRGPDTKGVLDILLKVKKLVFILGNHDYWLLKWLDGEIDPNWDLNGGEETRRSFDNDRKNVSEAHRKLLKSGKPYHEQTVLVKGKELKCLFVHGGFDPNTPISKQNQKELAWDRALFTRNEPIKGYDHVFIGHNRTVHLRTPQTVPRTTHNLTMMDTGVDAKGKLSILKLDDWTLTQA